MYNVVFVLYGGINFLLVCIIDLIVVINLFVGICGIKRWFVVFWSCFVFWFGWNNWIELFLVL